MPDNSDDDMESPVTRRELREELAKFEERFEQKLEQKLEQKFEQKFAAFRREISLDLARHVNAIWEQLRTEIRALGEPSKPSIPDELKTLPARVEKLEEHVFAPPKRRTPTRAARRR